MSLLIWGLLAIFITLIVYHFYNKHKDDSDSDSDSDTVIEGLENQGSDDMAPANIQSMVYKNNGNISTLYDALKRITETVDEIQKNNDKNSQRINLNSDRIKQMATQAQHQHKKNQQKIKKLKS